MAEVEQNSVKEGFLCPICHNDLRSPNSLISHFQDLHSEEQDVLKSIKGKRYFAIANVILNIFQLYMVKQKRKF